MHSTSDRVRANVLGLPTVKISTQNRFSPSPSPHLLQLLGEQFKGMVQHFGYVFFCCFFFLVLQRARWDNCHRSLSDNLIVSYKGFKIKNFIIKFIKLHLIPWRTLSHLAQNPQNSRPPSANHLSLPWPRNKGTAIQLYHSLNVWHANWFIFSAQGLHVEESFLSKTH